MPAQIGPPPRVNTRRHKYEPFLKLLTQNPTEWVSLPLDEIGGDTKTRKQNTILCSGRNVGLRLTTTIQGERLYARVVEARESGQASEVVR
jgi:hypothetical protein